MALNQKMQTLSTSIALIIADAKSVTVTNTHASQTVYLGNSYVTSSSYGVRLTAGQSITLNSVGGDLYGLASGANTDIAVLYSM